MKDATIASKSYVCSRHFCRSDFQEVKSNQRKYILKQGTLPTIFKWETSTTDDSKAIKIEANSETEVKAESVKDKTEKTIEPMPGTSNADTETATTKITPIDEENKIITANNNKKKKNNGINNSRKRAGSILIPNEEKPKKTSKRLSAAKMATTTTPTTSAVISDVAVTVVKTEIPATPDKTKTKNQEGPPPVGTPKKKNTIITFLPGSTIEAQSFDQKWITVKVIEVDIDEREVLVRFEKNCKSKTPG